LAIFSFPKTKIKAESITKETTAAFMANFSIKGDFLGFWSDDLTLSKAIYFAAFASNFFVMGGKRGLLSSI